MEDIECIQQEVTNKGIELNVLAFVHFLDILGWNDEMKTHADNEGLCFDRSKPKKGRINTILSCISVPMLFQDFVEEVLKNKDDPSKIDFSIIVDVAQTFSRTRGIHPLSNKKLVELFEPYLID